MLFYMLLLLSSMALTFFSVYAGRGLCIKLCLMIEVVLGIIASIRGYVGTDTFAYHTQFEVISRFNTLDENTLRIEPAFIAIARFIELFGGDSFGYVLSIGVLQTCLLMFILRRLERPSLFLVFYIATFYISFQFNILREGTSLLLIAISLIWIKADESKFFFTLLASIFFHYSSLLFVPYLLLYKKFLKKERVSMLSILIILMIIFGAAILLGDIINDKYEIYADEDQGGMSDFGFGLLLNLSLWILLGVILFKKNKIDVIFFILPIVLTKMLMVRYPIFYRIEFFFTFSLILLLTKNTVKDRESVIISVISLLNVYGKLNGIFSEQFKSYDLAHSLSPYIPYHTLFDINNP
jgi:hypothetical protein